MSYSQMAQLELLNAVRQINSEAELNEFKNLLAHYFAQKAQKAIDASIMALAAPDVCLSMSARHPRRGDACYQRDARKNAFSARRKYPFVSVCQRSL